MARSGEALASSDAITTSCGKLPAAYGVPAASVPSAFAKYTRTVPGNPLTATATSERPSPLRSPTAIALRLLGAGGVLSGACSVPSPFPRSTEMMLVLLLAVTTSSLPSPFTSPVATHQGAEAGYGSGALNVTAALAPGASAPSATAATSPTVRILTSSP